MKTSKRILAFLLAFLLMAGSAGLSAYAASGEPEAPAQSGIVLQAVTGEDQLPEGTDAGSLPGLRFPGEGGRILVRQEDETLTVVYKAVVTAEPGLTGRLTLSNPGVRALGEAGLDVTVGEEGTAVVFLAQSLDLTGAETREALASPEGCALSSGTVSLGELSSNAVSCQVKYGYTVTYTDGAAGEVFPDRSFLAALGDPTPAFDGEIVREGYLFAGWTPEPAQIVEADAVYTARWAVDLSGGLVTVTAPGSAVYNGQPQRLKPVLTDVQGQTLTEGEDYELSYSEDVTNVGPVTVTAAGKGAYAGTADAGYQIVKPDAGSFQTRVELANWTEGGTPNAPKAQVEGPCAAEYGEPQFSYSADGKTWTGESPAAFGEYTVRAVWEATRNLPELTAEAKFTVFHVHGELVEVKAKEATCEEDGCVAHYTCPVCGAVFADREGAKELKPEDVTVKAKGHKWGDWTVVTDATESTDGQRQRTCSVCKKVEKQSIPAKSAPKTGDEANPALWTVLTLAAFTGLGGAVLLGLKKRGLDR